MSPEPFRFLQVQGVSRRDEPKPSGGNRGLAGAVSAAVFGLRASVFVVLASVAMLAPGAAVAGRTVHACKPAIFTVADLASATGYARTNLLPTPHAVGAIPPAPGIAGVSGRAFVCDWQLVHWSEAGWGEGRVSVYEFPSSDDASSWFSAYIAAEKPSCRVTTVSFATAACVQVSPVPPVGAIPLFQAVHGQFVVWVSMKQQKLRVNAVQRLTAEVFAHTPQLP